MTTTFTTSTSNLAEHTQEPPKRLTLDSQGQQDTQRRSIGSAHILRAARVSPLKHALRSMQSIDAVLEQADYDHKIASARSMHLQTSAARQHVTGIISEHLNEDRDGSDDDFSDFDKLMESYEIACVDGDFGTLLSLPLPADSDDVWSEIEDVVIRNAQWDYLQQLMQKFEKRFDTDFLAEIVTSSYSDEHKICVIELALHSGWDINSPRSDGGYILSDALDNDTDVVIGCLLHYGANPNLSISDLTLDSEDPLSTFTGLPLQDAIQHGALQQIHMLLHHGARPDLANAIHLAIRSDEHEAWKIKLLLSYGADKNALEWAGNPQMSALLQENGIAPSAPIALAYSLGKAHVVQFLLDTNLDPSLIAPKGKDLPGIKRERKARLKARKDSMAKARLTGDANGKEKTWKARSPTSAGKTALVGMRSLPRAVKARRGVRMQARAHASVS